MPRRSRACAKTCVPTRRGRCTASPKPVTTPDKASQHKNLNDGGKAKGTHRKRCRDHLFPILDDNVDVRVCLGNNNRRGADAATDINEDRALGQVPPRET